MIVMREILNVNQTQVHPGGPSYGWKWKAFLDDLSDTSSAAQRRQGKGNTREQRESPPGCSRRAGGYSPVLRPTAAEGRLGRVPSA
jgi:hypothetical protein